MRIVGGVRKSVLVTEMKDLELGLMVSWNDARGGWKVGEDNVVDVVVQLTIWFGNKVVHRRTEQSTA
jgi:hypothetical protein